MRRLDAPVRRGKHRIARWRPSPPWRRSTQGRSDRISIGCWTCASHAWTAALRYVRAPALPPTRPPTCPRSRALADVANATHPCARVRARLVRFPRAAWPHCWRASRTHPRRRRRQSAAVLGRRQRQPQGRPKPRRPTRGRSSPCGSLPPATACSTGCSTALTKVGHPPRAACCVGPSAGRT